MSDETKDSGKVALSPEQQAKYEEAMSKVIRLKVTMDTQGEPVLLAALNLTGVLLILGTLHRGVVLAEQALKAEQEEGKTPEDEMTAKLVAASLAKTQTFAFDQGAKAFLEANPALVKANPAAQRMLDQVLCHIPTGEPDANVCACQEGHTCQSCEDETLDEQG